MLNLLSDRRYLRPRHASGSGAGLALHGLGRPFKLGSADGVILVMLVLWLFSTFAPRITQLLSVEGSLPLGMELVCSAQASAGASDPRSPQELPKDLGEHGCGYCVLLSHVVPILGVQAPTSRPPVAVRTGWGEGCQPSTRHGRFAAAPPPCRAPPELI